MFNFRKENLPSKSLKGLDYFIHQPVMFESCSCSTISPTFHVDSLFYFSHSNNRWHLTVVLICISLMSEDAEHLSTCLLAICVTYFVNYLFKVHRSIHSDKQSCITTITIIIQKISISSKSSLVLFCNRPTPIPSPQKLFASHIILAFPEGHINRIRQYVTF